MKGFLGVALLPLLTVASPVAVESIHNGAAPILSSTNAKEIPDSYIVVFKKHIDSDAASVHHSWVQDIHGQQTGRSDLKKRFLGLEFGFGDELYEGLKDTFNIAGSLIGYSGHFHEDTIEEIRKHPDVEYIERNSEVHTLEDSAVEKNAPWGLARISHRDRLSFGTFNKYLYASEGGEGVDVYTIDTGINIDHEDFGGRASWGKTIPTNDEDADGNGHGTHCSGTIGGTKYGVSKKAKLYAVKVLRSSGSGTMADVVQGVEWAVESHIKKAKKGGKGFKGSVANMSLGGGKSKTLEDAVNAGVEAGVHFAVAAGNDNADACSYSPAAAEKAVTVGASTLGDERAYFSNYGKCTDIFAPGLNILSTWIGSEHAVNTISGTSMASPHIAGLLAYFVSLQPSKESAFAVELTPEKLKKDIISIATEGILTDIPADTPNLLAWNGGGSSNYSDIVASGGYKTHANTASESEFKAGVPNSTQTTMRMFKYLSGLLLAGAAVAQNNSNSSSTGSCTASSSDSDVVQYAWALQSLLERYYGSQPLNQTFLQSASNNSSSQSLQNFQGIQRQTRLGVRAVQQVATQTGNSSSPRCNYNFPNATSGQEFLKTALKLETGVSSALLGATGYTQSPEVSFLLARLAAQHTADATWLATLQGGQVFPTNSSSLLPAYNPTYVLGSGNQTGRLGQYLNGCVSAPSPPCGDVFYIGPLVGSVGNQTSATVGSSSSASISPTARALRWGH
ncbi:peptidase S8/S53 domain-containing protein [Aspergillus pseudoustus]|uniref:Peptidase S8/S53 domain-containing protein n=1 Tax=Aspergillus pseudoustus TaxID=1810923 RepID=A0ABR4K351_9EURO